MGVKDVIETIPVPRDYQLVRGATTNVNSKCVMVTGFSIEPKSRSLNEYTFEICLVNTGATANLIKSFEALYEGFDLFHEALKSNQGWILGQVYGPYQLDNLAAIDITIQTVR